jgi:endonuclease-3 related protein
MARRTLPWPSRLRRRLVRLRHALAARYGPQGWTPARPAVEVVLGAILARNAPGVNVEPVLARLRAAGLLAPAARAAGPAPRLRAGLARAGVPGPAAAAILALAAHLRARHGGRLARLLAQPAAGLQAELRGLPGIGREAADTIVLHAANRPVFVVTAAARRILGRHGIAAPATPAAAIQALVDDNLPRDPALFRELHLGLARVGREYCRAVPRCAACPLRRDLPPGGPLPLRSPPGPPRAAEAQARLTR